MTARSAGFTLLEVLVALSLLALLGLALLGLVRTTAGLSADLRDRFETAADLRTARSLLAERLARALPLRRATEAGPVLAFSGGPDGLRFVAAEPPYARSKGLLAWEFALTPRAGETFLEVRVAPAARAGDPLRPLEAAPWRRLARVTGRLRLAYLSEAGAGGNGPWAAEWRDRTVPPRAVLLVGDDAADWPPLVVPLRIPELGGCADEAAGASACPS